MFAININCSLAFKNIIFIVILLTNIPQFRTFLYRYLYILVILINVNLMILKTYSKTCSKIPNKIILSVEKYRKRLKILAYNFCV